MKNPNVIIAILTITQVATYISLVNTMINLKKEKRRYKKLYDLTHYVLDVAEKQGVNIGEFDLIALQAISEGNDVSRG